MKFGSKVYLFYTFDEEIPVPSDKVGIKMTRFLHPQVRVDVQMKIPVPSDKVGIQMTRSLHPQVRVDVQMKIPVPSDKVGIQMTRSLHLQVKSRCPDEDSCAFNKSWYPDDEIPASSSKKSMSR